MSLTHNELIKLGKELDYSLGKEGICAGFVGMLMQESHRPAFYERLNLIALYKKNFARLKKKINQVKEKVRRKEIINEHEQAYLDIDVFFNGIMLYSSPESFPKLFNKHVTQQNLPEIYSLSKPASNEHSQLAILLDKDLARSYKGLVNYLKALKLILSKHGSSVLACLSNYEHMVYFNYDQNDHCFHYVDINDLEFCYLRDTIYHRKLGAKLLARHLCISFEVDKYLVFNLKLISMEKNPKLEEDLIKFNENYYIKKKHIRRYDKDGAGLLYIACLEKHQSTVDWLIKNKAKVNQVLKSGRTPLYFACRIGDLELVQILLKNNAKVNISTREGNTPLFMACFYGYLDIVKALLETVLT